MDLQQLLLPKNVPLSKTDQKIYNYMIKHPQRVQFETIQKIATDVHTSVASVQRFCKKLGYDGFKEFKFQFKHSLLNQEEMSSTSNSSYLERYQTMLKMFNQISPATIKQLSDALLNCQTVYTMGIYYSGIPARFLAMALRDRNINGTFIEDYITGSHYTGLMSDNASFIFFSIMGEENYFKKYLADRIKNLDKSYLITFNPDNKLIPYFKHVILLPGKSFVYNQVLDPQSLMCIFVEMLIAKIAEEDK